jgi:hypothetical protein
MIIGYKAVADETKSNSCRREPPVFEFWIFIACKTIKPLNLPKEISGLA